MLLKTVELGEIPPPPLPLSREHHATVHNYPKRTSSCPQVLTTFQLITSIINQQWRIACKRRSAEAHLVAAKSLPHRSVLIEVW